MKKNLYIYLFILIIIIFGFFIIFNKKKKNNSIQENFSGIACSADYGSSKVCCNQISTSNDYEGHVRACPADTPKCVNYKANQHYGNCVKDHQPTTDKDGIIKDSACLPNCQYPDGFKIGVFHICLGDQQCAAQWDTSMWNDTVGRATRSFKYADSPLYDNKGLPAHTSDWSTGWNNWWNTQETQINNDINHIMAVDMTYFYTNPLMTWRGQNNLQKKAVTIWAIIGMRYLHGLMSCMRDTYKIIVLSLQKVSTLVDAHLLFSSCARLLILLESDGFKDNYNSTTNNFAVRFTSMVNQIAQSAIGYSMQKNGNFLKTGYGIYNVGIQLVQLINIYNLHVKKSTNELSTILQNFRNIIISPDLYKFLDLEKFLDIEYKNVFAELGGNLYEFTGNEFGPNSNYQPKDAKISQDQIPMSVAERAYDNFLAATLQNCYSKYNLKAISLPDFWNRLEKMNNVKNLIMESKEIKNPDFTNGTIEATREIFFDKLKNAWRESENNTQGSPFQYGNCNPIINEKVDPGPPGQNLFNFKDETHNLALENKKLLLVAQNLFKNMFGKDETFIYPWFSMPSCPTVNENVNPTNMVLSPKQDDICISNPLSVNKYNQEMTGNMEPGKIINGQDIWLKNAENLQNNMDDIQNTLGLPINKLQWSGDQFKKIHPKWKSMWLLANNQLQNILIDRDWELSTINWKKQNQNYIKNTDNFIKETILPIYKNLEMTNSLPLDGVNINNNFSVSYDDEGTVSNINLNMLWLPSKPLNGISNVTFNTESPYKNGFIRIYKNANQYEDYNTTDKIIGPSKRFTNLSVDVFAGIYLSFFWNLLDFVNDRRDVYIMCSNLNFTKVGYENLYSSDNYYMGRHVYEQLEKCYYAPKNRSPSYAPYGAGKNQLFMKWSIIKTSDPNMFRLYNIETKSYLAWGVNYSLQKNFNWGTALPDGIFDKNKSDRPPMLYFIGQDRLYNECTKSSGICSSLKNDAGWKFKSLGMNKYQIIHSSQSILWYSNDLITYSAPENFNTSKTIENVSESLGYLSCEKYDESSSLNNDNCIKRSTGSECIKTTFIIVPVEPTNISSQFLESNFNHQDTSKKIDTSLINKNLNNFNDYDQTARWFRNYDVNNKYSYADLDSNGVLKPDSKNKNHWVDIYDTFATQNVFFENGELGEKCAASNFTHVEPELTSNEITEASGGFLKIYPGKDFRGNDLGGPRGVSLEQCADICRKNNRCVGITYGSNGGLCFTKYKMDEVFSNPKAGLNSYLINKSQQFKKIGSYKDEPNRALPDYKGMVSNAQQCAELCNGYQYFGLQDRQPNNQSQCFCGNDLDKAKQYGASNCNEYGGIWCNYIYELTSPYNMENLDVKTTDSEDTTNNFNLQDNSNPVPVHTFITDIPVDGPFKGFGWPWPSGNHNFTIKNYFKAPLFRHNFKCKINAILFVNVEAYLSNNISFMNSRSFGTFSNPNVTYFYNLERQGDISYSGFKEWFNKRVAVNVWVDNQSLIEGTHFGISPYGNYIWWDGNIDAGSIKFRYQSLGEIGAKYITLFNTSANSEFKKNKVTLCNWYDLYKFNAVGYSYNSMNGSVYCYTKTIDKSFKEIE